MWTAAALGITVLMGGGIAYLGDLIGRRYGKRRASLFGLRPKHTAILVTSVMGVLISLFTTFTLFILVQPVRRVIMEGEAAIRSSARLRREIAALDIDIKRERQSAQDARNYRRQAVSERDAAQRQVALAGRRLAAIRIELETAQSKLSEARAARLRAEQAAQLAEERVRDERAAARVLAARNEDLRRASKTLEARNLQLAGESEALKSSNSALAVSNVRYSQENEAISKQNMELTREMETLTGTVSSLRGEQERLAGETKALEASLEALREGYATAYGAHRSLWEMFEALRTRKIAVECGQDIARIVVPPNTPPDGVRARIRELMQEAHSAALAKGSAPGEAALAVQIVDKRFVTPTSTGPATLRVTEQDRIDAVVNRLAWSREAACVLALAVSNSVVGEPAGIDLQPLPNPMVYRKGQVVATRRLDGKQPAGVVFNELVAFLKGVGQSALTRGLIPQIDPGTGEPQVGSLSGAELVGLADRVRSFGRQVDVTVVASADTNASDGLRLEFRFRPGI